MLANERPWLNSSTQRFALSTNVEGPDDSGLHTTGGGCSGKAPTGVPDTGPQPGDDAIVVDGAAPTVVGTASAVVGDAVIVVDGAAMVVGGVVVVAAGAVVVVGSIVVVGGTAARVGGTDPVENPGAIVVTGAPIAVGPLVESHPARRDTDANAARTAVDALVRDEAGELRTMEDLQEAADACLG